MLRPPYRRYQRLYTYHLDQTPLPSLDDPDLIGAWGEDDGTVLFFHRPKERLIAELCRQTGARLHYQADLDYEEWEAGREIVPFQVGDLRVAPAWDEQEADIRLDPSVIFGSGFHPSTRLCLEMLLKYVNNDGQTGLNGSADHPPAGSQPAAAVKHFLPVKRALDLGCGTGLLAIAAARRGVAQVLAVDNNPLACQVAAANCRLNQVEERVTVRQLDLRREPPATGEFDLVMANLYQGLLRELMANPDFWLARYHILAGFITPMEEELLALLPADRVRLVERISRERWCCWVLAAR